MAKLDQKQKDIISNTLSLFLVKNPDALVGLNTVMSNDDHLKKDLINKMSKLEEMYLTEKFSSNISIDDLTKFIEVDPKQRTNDILGTLYEYQRGHCENWFYTNKYYL